MNSYETTFSTQIFMIYYYQSLAFIFCNYSKVKFPVILQGKGNSQLGCALALANSSFSAVDQWSNTYALQCNFMYRRLQCNA